MTYQGPERLERRHRFDDFDCGEDPLNHWATKIAKSANGSGSSTVFVVTPAESSRVVGFHALAAASVEKVHVPARAAKFMPQSVPCILLARLAVDLNHQGAGLGSALLKDAFLRSVTAADAVGARAMLVHAKHEKARDWYMRFAFEPSPTDPLHLWLLMDDIRTSIDAARQV